MQTDPWGTPPHPTDAPAAPTAPTTPTAASDPAAPAAPAAPVAPEPPSAPPVDHAPVPPSAPPVAPEPPSAPPVDPVPPAPPAPTVPVAPEPPSAPPVDPAPAQSAQGDDIAAQLKALQDKLAELEQKTSSGQLTLAQTDQELAQKVDELRQQFEEWPQRGGMGDVPQPYDLIGHGLPAPGVTRDYLPAGAPDELSPVVIAHDKPILAPGTAGDQVIELATLLGRLGYSNSVTHGRNFSAAFDDTIASAVAAFRRDFHIEEDPSQFPPNSGQHETFVGPWTWEALIRACRLAAF